MSATILLASGNAKKLAELRRLVESVHLDLTVVGLADVAAYPEPAEDGASFEANALIKARAGFAVTGLPTLADDSGLAVDALNRMPGIRSARWSGPDATDESNLDLVLRQLWDVPEGRRSAQFVCAVALVAPGQDELVLRRELTGHLATTPRGDGGFGYDPVFIPDGYSRTTAELSPSEKDAISHRGQAMRAILPALAALAQEA